jgi:glycerophosphoryl diester phosphodiesterase
MIGALIAFSVINGEMNASTLIGQSWDSTHVVGHRGAAAYAPENTLLAFKKAIESQADAAECDVHMSRDGVPFVIHDSTLKRTFGIEGVVKDMTADELKKASVPTLAEYIQVLKGKCVQVIEIKDGVGVVAATVREVVRAGTQKETIFFSFNSVFVKEAKDLQPSIPAIWLVGAKYEPSTFDTLMKLKGECHADGLGFAYTNVSSELAGFLRKDRVPLFVWTVPPGEEVDRLKECRVNFIITNHPKDVRTQLGM